MKKLLGVILVFIISVGLINDNFTEQVSNDSADSTFQESTVIETFGQEGEFPD